MKEEFLENKRLYSPYILCVYMLSVGLINYFIPSYLIVFNNFPNAQDDTRSAFLIGGAFFIFQIYNTSTVLYQRLIDTIVVMGLVLNLVYPTMCFLGAFIFSPNYFYLVFIHFIIFYFILNDKNK